jgi:hypothetical protein
MEWNVPIPAFRRSPGDPSSFGVKPRPARIYLSDHQGWAIMRRCGHALETINAMSWYILNETDVTGPFDHKEMDLRLSRGEIARDAMVGRGADGPWGKADNVFPLAFGIISATAMPPVFTTEVARRLLSPAIPGGRSTKTAPIPLGVSPATSSHGEIRQPDSPSAVPPTEPPRGG